jgi:hypothetical protein
MQDHDEDTTQEASKDQQDWMTSIDESNMLEIGVDVRCGTSAACDI